MILTTNFIHCESLFHTHVNQPIKRLLVLGCDSLIHKIELKITDILSIDWNDAKLDITEIPFCLGDKSFDTVTLFGVLEYLTKTQALKLLHGLKRIVKNQIVLFIPIGQKGRNGLSENYLSYWSVEELQEIGFSGEHSKKDEYNHEVVFAVLNISHTPRNILL